MALSFLRKSDPLGKKRMKCRRKFLYYFKKGFKDQKYIDWERKYKLDAHFLFQEELSKEDYQALLNAKKYEDIAAKAVRIESRTNLLFSFEKMALRDAIKISPGAKDFATGLFDYVYGKENLQQRFEQFSALIRTLPRKQQGYTHGLFKLFLDLSPIPRNTSSLNPGSRRWPQKNMVFLLSISPAPTGIPTRVFWILRNRSARILPICSPVTI